jgi:hypothetical protein
MLPREGEAGEVRRRPQAVAGRQRGAQARGKPQTLLGVDTTEEGRQLLRHGRGTPDTEPCGHLGAAVAHRPGKRRDHPLDAPGVSSPAESSAVGKARHTGTAMTDGRRPHRTLLPDPVGSAHQQPTSLQGRANKAKTDTQHRCRDLDGGREADLVLAGWRDLHTPAASGVDGLTAHAYEAKRQANIPAVVHRLKTHRSRATLVRRCSLPKENGAERP